MSQTRTRLQKAANYYTTQLRWPIHALLPRSKEPATPHGFKDAGFDLRDWQINPANNIGLACDRAGIVVLDIDPRNGGDEDKLPSLFGDEVVDTVSQLTGSGGIHLLFSVPDKVEIGVGKFKELPGVDVKWHGYIVLAPSIHPNGEEYLWRKGHEPWTRPLRELTSVPRLFQRLRYVPPPPLKELPAQQAMRRELDKQRGQKYGRAALEGAVADVLAEVQGHRHTLLYARARWLGEIARLCDLSSNEIERRLKEAGAAAGLGRIEVPRTVRDGLEDGLAAPLRQLPDNRATWLIERARR